MDHLADFCVIKRQVKPQNNAARERTRVKTLRSAFLDLQRSLPAVPPNTKLSKLDILVLATAYIFHLTRALEGDNLQEASTSASQGHLGSSGSTAQSGISHGTATHKHQQTGISAAVSSSNAHTSLTTESVGKHKRVGCYEQSTPSSKCRSFGYTPCDSDNAFQQEHFSEATHAPSHTSVSANQGNHPLKGTVGILHPVKKWPMRSRLYDSILGCAANTSIIPSSKSATASSFSIAQ